MEMGILDKKCCADPLCVSGTTLSLLRSGAGLVACSAAGEGNDPSASSLPWNLAWFPPVDWGERSDGLLTVPADVSAVVESG
jgi:hypothetical protein